MKRAWMRFYTVGLGGMGVQTLMMTILKGGLGLHYLAATVIAVETAVLHNFYWHERWTWAHRNLEWSTMAARLLRFNAGNGLIALVGQAGIMWVLVSKLNVHYLVAMGASIGTCSLVNFMVSDRLVFREETPAAGGKTSGATEIEPKKNARAATRRPG